MSSGGAEGEPIMEMNTTPLIDVMLVLIIMFIITIPIQTHAVKINLPVNNPNPPPVIIKPDFNTLSVDTQNNITWNGSPIDIETLRTLEDGIASFSGCAVVISHDRWFLDRVCTHILAFEGDSTVYWFEGGYSEYEENRKKRLGNVEPKRPRYKKLAV